uniref:Tim44-like domain-containing protein n=1 Tax=Guillardia theta TaxID=55529 RepID=A0A6U6DJF7_GUITH|mmetsp:Transcript_6191/g.21950  ORF Transcript_6191/g.21950 Transcript_6191/m.21950 type:complete len:231 (+) Transcript_6191:96-788(+)
MRQFFTRILRTQPLQRLGWKKGIEGTVANSLVKFGSFQQTRSFRSTRLLKCKDEDKEIDAKMKHVMYRPYKKIRIGFIRKFFLDMNIRALKLLSENNFDETEFLDGAIFAIESAMKSISSHDVDSLRGLVGEKFLTAVEEAEKLMKETELRAEQQVSKIYESEIVSVGFLTDEEGEDFAQVSVQVSYDQKTSIKDLHDRHAVHPASTARSRSIRRDVVVAGSSVSPESLC